MKYVIYYFSGTGNNLRVAQKLQQELGNTYIFTFRKLLEDKIIDEIYTHVIFSVPSYFSHIPPFIKECMKNLKFSANQKIITIICCGIN